MIRKLSFLLALVLVLVTTGPVTAQTAIDYYKDLFDKWKIPVDILPQESLKLDTPATKKDLQALLKQLEGDVTEQKPAGEEIVITNTTGRYLLLLASQFQTTPQDESRISSYQKIIVVCDSAESASLPQGISCAANNLSFVDQNPSESSVSDEILQVIRPVTINSVSYYLIPQVLLITPQYQDSLGSYFKALSRAQAAANVSDNKVTADVAALDLLSNIKESSIFESTVYALVFLLFVVAIKNPLSTLVNNPRKFLEKEFYVTQLQRVIDLVARNSGGISFIFLILAIFYIPILYALTVKANLLGDPTYPMKYLSTTMNPLNIPNYLTAQNLFRVGLLFYHYALALFGFLLVLPNFVKVITKSGKKMREVKLKTTFIKWLIPGTVAVNGLLLTFVELKSLVSFLALSVVVLGLALLYLKSRNITYADLFSNKERRVTALAVLAVLVLNVCYPLFQSKLPTKYAYEPLIGINDEVIVYPYSKKWGKNVLFDPFYYTGTSKVYADGYLIYSRNTVRIENKPLSKFNGTGSFSVVSRKLNGVLEAALNNPSLANYISSAGFSPIFIADSASNAIYNASVLKVQLSFNCNLSPSPTTVKLETLTSTDSQENTVYTESTEMMRFPGCRVDSGLETFEVPLDPHVIPQGDSILRLRGVDAKYMTNLKVLAGEKELPVKFINKEVLNESQYKILYSSPNQTNDIVNYSTDVKKEFIVNVGSTNQGFDLSGPINELMQTGALRNPFIIWTDKPNEIIQKNEED